MNRMGNLLPPKGSENSSRGGHVFKYRLKPAISCQRTLTRNCSWIPHKLLRACKKLQILLSRKSGFDEVFEFSNSETCKVQLIAEIDTA